MLATEQLAVSDVAELARGFELSLRVRNRSPKTIGYHEDHVEERALAGR
jgi:hypothetical protein